MIDRKVFSYLILGLVGALLLSVIGVIVLTASDHDVPGVLENVVVGLVTGLLGLFAKTPTGDPQPVNVVNAPGDPVPVDPQAGASALEVVVIVLVVIVILILIGFVPR